MIDIKKLRNNELSISHAFALKLASVVMVVLVFVVFSMFIIKDKIYNDYVARILLSQAEDVRHQLIKLTDLDSLQYAKIVTYMWENIEHKTETKRWWNLANFLGIREIDLVSSDGVVKKSSVPSRVGLSILKDPAMSKFKGLLYSRDTYEGYIEPIDNELVLKKSFYRYAGVRLTKGGFLRFGTDIETLVTIIDAHAAKFLNDFHIGHAGFVLVLTPRNQILNIPRDIMARIDAKDLQNNFNFRATGVSTARMKGKDYLYVTSNFYGYSIIALLPKEEASKATHLFFYSFVTLFAIAFFVMFLETNNLIKKTVLDNIYNINLALSRIANGKLDTNIDVSDSPEFRELCNGINHTVKALKENLEERQKAVMLELEIAKNIQFSSLPQETAIFNNSDDFEIFAQMDTAKEVGGDFYDYYNVTENKIVFLVADVSGKGVYAAMFMMRAKTLLKAIARNNYDNPAEILYRANEILCEENSVEMFLTCWLGVLDQDTGKITYANAGHNYPIFIKNGSVEFLSHKPNFLLAGMKNIKYTNYTVYLGAGDKILLYTDGVNEAQNDYGKFYGNERLLSTVTDVNDYCAASLCKFVRQSVKDFVNGAEQADDVTLLCLAARDRYVFNFKPDIESVPLVLDYLESKLSELGINRKIILHVCIASDEICANIAQYSGADCASLKIYKKDKFLVIYFNSNGVLFNPLRNEDPDVTLTAQERIPGGLGILIVKKLIDSVSYESKNGQNILRMEIRLDDCAMI
ncbi:MAG: SpoIIE family protein phosphatase [Synergistaceae bacterium]|nr:SpoIIE family protein phosphatase [Synergistaceae bacterium]